MPQFILNIVEFLVKFSSNIYSVPKNHAPAFLNFLFFSSSHELWHTILIGAMWLCIYGLIYGFIILVYIELMRSACQETINEYGVPLFNTLIIVLYAVAFGFPLLNVLVSPDEHSALLIRWMYTVVPGVPIAIWIYYIIKIKGNAIAVILLQIFALLGTAALVLALLIPVILVASFYVLGFIIKILQPTKKVTYTYSDGSTETRYE